MAEEQRATPGGHTGLHAWRAVGALVIVIAAGATGWFLWKSGFLTRTLNDHYARTVARFAREVELRAGSYRSVLSSLTQLPGVVDEPSPTRRLLLGADARVLAVRKAEQSLQARDAELAAALGESRLALERARAQFLSPTQPTVEPKRLAAALDASVESLEHANTAASTLQEFSEELRGLLAAAVDAQRAADLAVRNDTQADAESAKAEVIARVAKTRGELAELERGLTTALLDLAAKTRTLQRAANPTDTGSALVERLEELAGSGQDALRSLRGGEDGTDRNLVRDRQILQSVLPSYQDVVAGCLAVDGPEGHAAGQRNAARDLCVAQGLIRGNEGATDSARRTIELGACAPSLPRGVVAFSRAQSALTFTPKGEQALDVCGQVGLGKLLSGLGPAQGGLERTAPHTFDAIVLLDDKGRVLVGPPADSPLRVLRIPGFDEKRATASHVMSEVALGPRKYSLFLQPIELPLVSVCTAGSEGCPEGKQPIQLVLAGLVFEERMASERLEVTPGTYLWAIVLLSFVVLALPLAKLWLLGPTSRLRRFDVSLLVASAAAATLLVTLLSLSAAAFFQLRGAVDHDLAEVGNAIALTVERHHEAGVTLLDDFRGQTEKLQRAVASGDLTALGKACTDPAGFVPSLGACEQLEAPLATGSGARWEQAFLADSNGQQRVKWTSGRETTNMVNVARRSYFKRAKERACRANEACGDAHAVEVVRSLTTGSLQLVVARAFDKAHAPGSAVKGVAGITLPLPEFQKMVLPLGYQMAVIDGDGKLMLHSGSSAFQGQNFLDDVDSPAALRAAMHKQGESWLTLRYLGERSRVRVASLPSSGWSVVVVAPFSLIDLPLAQSVLMTLAAFVVVTMLGLAVFGFILYAARLRRRRLRKVEQEALLTLRPRAACRHDYQEATWFMVAGGAAPIAALLLPYGLVPLLLLLPCGLVAFGAIMRVPGLGRNGALAALRPRGDGWPAKLIRLYLGEPSSDPRRFPFAPRLSFVSVYSSCCFALAAVVVTAPACVLFAGAHDHMLETLARAQQGHLARESVPLDCLQQGPRKPDCAHVYLASSPTSNSADVWGSKTRNELLANAQSFLPQFEPVRGSAAALLVLAKSPPEPPQLTWVWERAGTDLRLGPVNQPKSAGLHSELPTLAGWCALVPLLGLGVWALASYLLSLRVFKRLFHMRLLEQLGQHSTSDLAVTLAQLCVEENAPVRVYIPNLSDIDLARVQAEFERSSTDLPPIWTRNGVLEATASEIEPPYVIASYDDDPLSPPDAKTLDDLRDYDELRRAPSIHPHLATLAAPKRPALEALWSNCDEDEKRVLSQIAFDDYPNPHPNTALVLKRLAEKGLIDSSTLAIPRRAFVDYIASTIKPAELEQWSKSEKNTSWTAMRGFLVAALATLAAVLTALQPSLGAATATVPALAAAIPTLLRVLNVFAGSDGGK